MKLTISQELLHAALGRVLAACAQRPINPVLGCVRLQAEGDSLALTCTDGEFTLRYRVAINPEGAKPGACLVNGRLLRSLVGLLPHADLELVLSDDGSSQYLGVICGGTVYRLSAMTDEYFPELPTFEDRPKIPLAIAPLKRALQLVVFASVAESTTGAVHYTNGVYLEFVHGGYDLVATDGHRMAVAHVEDVGLSGDGMLIPSRVCAHLQALLPGTADLFGGAGEGSLELYHLGSQVVLRFGQLTVTTALLDVKFPPFRSVIAKPESIETKAYLRQSDFAACLARLALLNRQKDQNPVVLFQAEGDLADLSSEAGEIGEGKERMPVELAAGGARTDDKAQPVKVRFNPAYVAQAIGLLRGDSVTLHWANQVNPFQLTSPREPDWTYVVMPIRMD